MTDADSVRLARALYVLGEVFREDVSDVRADAYFDALHDLSIEVVERAIRHAIRHSKFFPRPVELREFIEGRSEDRAALAWSTLLEAVQDVGYYRVPSFEDAAIGSTVRALWGSWRRLCQTLPGDGPELLGWMKRFEAHYQVVASRISEYPELSEASASELLASLVNPSWRARQLKEATSASALTDHDGAVSET